MDIPKSGAFCYEDSLIIARLRSEIIREQGFKEQTYAVNAALKVDNAKLRKDVARLVNALKSIAANTCCDNCQEAALVAKEAISQFDKED